MFYNFLVDKKSLQDNIKETYRIINQQTISIKTVLLGFCVDIERFFKLKLNIDIHKPLLDENIPSIYQYFPSLKAMTIDQLHRLMLVLVNVRNSNAHLHTNRNVFLDDDIREYFSNIAKPQYEVSVDKKITIYGCFYILVFLSQKYQLWHVCSSLFRSNLFIEIEKKAMINFQTSTQHYFQEFCGYGKPIYGEGANEYGKTIAQFLNELNKRYLTDLFFDLEMAIYPSKNSDHEVLSFVNILYSTNIFEKGSTLPVEILKLRNLWFHGAWLFDTVMVNDQPIKFDLPFILELLLKIKNFLLDKPEFQPVIKDLHDYGSAIYDFYCLRIIEVSYKLLDKRLLTQEKIDSRTIDSMNAYQRLLQIDEKIFIAAGELINKKEIRWLVIPNKLSDLKPRTMSTEILNVYHLHSESGFEIGGVQTNAKQIALVLVGLQSGFENQVNGKYLSEYSIHKERMIGKRIKIIECS